MGELLTEAAILAAQDWLLESPEAQAAVPSRKARLMLLHPMRESIEASFRLRRARSGEHQSPIQTEVGRDPAVMPSAPSRVSPSRPSGFPSGVKRCRKCKSQSLVAWRDGTWACQKCDLV